MKVWSDVVVKAKNLLTLSREAVKECAAVVAPSKPFVDDIKEKLDVYTATQALIIGRAWLIAFQSRICIL